MERLSKSLSRQNDSGDLDYYPTPHWVTRALFEHMPDGIFSGDSSYWEPDIFSAKQGIDL